MLSERVQRLKDNHVPKFFKSGDYVSPLYLSINRTRHFTESWKNTEGEPTSLRRAKAFANALDKMPIFIRPDELIVGFYAEDQHALPVCIESVNPKVIEGFIENKKVKEDEVDEWKEHIEYWRHKNVATTVEALCTEEEMKLASSANTYMEVLPGEYTSRAQVEHDLYLEKGLNGILDSLKDKLSKLEVERSENGGGTEAIKILEKIIDLKAMIITAEAVIRWAERYSKLAAKMAKGEKDPKRKKELENIAEICSWVPANPARTFWEAVQSHWLCSLAYQIIENLSHGTSMRLDVVFEKWFEKDVVKDKILPREVALEIMEDLLIKVDELGRPLPLWRRTALQGANFLATYTIAGVKPEDGSDASSETTLLILDAIDDLKLNHPDFKFRWHPKVNTRIFKRCLEVVRNGLGQPSIKNDPIVIEGLMNHYGFSIEEARSWSVVGCISPAPTIGQGRARRDAIGTTPLKWLELTLHNGVEPVFAPRVGQQVGLKTGDPTEFKSFDELFEAYTKQYAYSLRVAFRVKTISEHYSNIMIKRPFLSCLYRRSLESCRDITDTPEKGMPWANDPGKVDSVDSLIALKKLVYDDNKYTMKEVLKALKADWKGYEEMRQEFINAPKFGNNNSYADEIAKRVYTMIADEMSKVKDQNNASPMPSGLVVTRMWLLADKIGAMPNGRRFNDPLADGGINPHAGYDKNGPMAAIISASKIDATKQKANIFNQKLSPSNVAGEEGLQKFYDYVTASMNLGLDMIQFNIVDSKMLKDAQKDPDKYPNLVVRVSGYNAHFNDLDKFVQDAVIERTQHNL